MFKVLSSKASGNPEYPEGLLKLEYAGDWALAFPQGETGVVAIHGHGSHGDQLFVRKDIIPWGKFAIGHGLGLLMPDLYGNEWMSPKAADALAQLIVHAKKTFGWKKIVLCDGSMGGTSNLIFAGLHPELADGVVALGAASDLASYAHWCDSSPFPIGAEIAAAIRKAYHNDTALMDSHSVWKNAEKLTMPVMLYHGSADVIIPVSQSRTLAGKLAEHRDFFYSEIYEGNHDSPLPFFEDSLTKILHKLGVWK